MHSTYPAESAAIESFSTEQLRVERRGVGTSAASADGGSGGGRFNCCSS